MQPEIPEVPVLTRGCWHLSTVWPSDVYDRHLEEYRGLEQMTSLVHVYIPAFITFHSYLTNKKLSPSQMLQSEFAALVALSCPDFTSTADPT